MDRDLSHDDVAELLGAFALDAVEPSEAEAVRAHLAECPRCAAEVAEHREVAGLIANAGVDAPAELWDRIAERINDTGNRPPPLRSVSATPRPIPPARGRRGRTVAWAALGAVAAALVAVITALAVQVGHLDHQVGALPSAAAQAGIDGAVQAALLDPAATQVTLATPTGARAAVLVILPSGSAFALNTALPAIPADRTYQLWAFVGARPVSLGLLGSSPDRVAFTVDPEARVSAFAVTDEAAGGAVAPTAAPVARSASTA